MYLVLGITALFPVVGTKQNINVSLCILQVKKLIEELNKRIFEHDSAAVQGFDRPEVTLQVYSNISPSWKIQCLNYTGIYFLVLTGLQVYKRQGELCICSTNKREGIGLSSPETIAI